MKKNFINFILTMTTIAVVVLLVTLGDRIKSKQTEVIVLCLYYYLFRFYITPINNITVTKENHSSSLKLTELASALIRIHLKEK